MSLPEQFLLGIYVGVITGILPGIVSWALAFVFKYFTRVTVPALGTMVVAVGLAGVQGGLLGLLDVQGVTAITALLVVMMISMYCHSQGDQMGAGFPHRVTLRTLKDRTLSADVVEKIGKFGQVRIEVSGEVVEMEGYAPLSEETKKHIKETDWTFPADLSVSELEERMGEKLTETFDLSDVSVSIDSEGNAKVIAAPPTAGLSKRLQKGGRAVSFQTLVPTGLSRGDEVLVWVGGSTVTGTVVSAKSGIEKDGGETTETLDETADEEEVVPRKAPSATGGEGRVTVAVDRGTATNILEENPERMVVKSRGNRREFELISTLKSAGKSFDKVAVENCVGDGETFATVVARDRFGVIVLAVKRGQKRTLATHGDEEIVVGDELFVVGTEEGVENFKEAVR